VLHEQFHNAADADLFVVVEGLKPAGELVGASNSQATPSIMPYTA
jgi:hypothetical protein